MRVVSLLPSATEIVCALGHRADLVARSAECDFPAEVNTLPAVMRPTALDADEPSRAIDARVREVRGRGESLYTLDIPALRALRPELLFTQDLCSVCSVTDREVAEACSVAGIAPRIVSLSPRTLPEVWDSVAAVADALGDPPAGARLCSSLRARSERRGAGQGPRVAVVEWLDPPILAGLWTPEIVRAGGGRPIGPDPGTPGTRTDWAALRSESPDLLILSPCSFSVPRTLRELEDPSLAAALGRVEAPRGVVVADEAYFSRPGPRLADGVELIRGLVEGRPGPAPMPLARWSSAPGAAA
jgi:iron complex transport system substrate-binding protein